MSNKMVGGYSKILIAVPPALLANVDRVAQYESRSRSDLVREMMRRYVEDFQNKHRQPIDLPPPKTLEVPVQPSALIKEVLPLDCPMPGRVKSLLS